MNGVTRLEAGQAKSCHFTLTLDWEWGKSLKSILRDVVLILFIIWERKKKKKLRDLVKAGIVRWWWVGVFLNFFKMTSCASRLTVVVTECWFRVAIARGTMHLLRFTQGKKFKEEREKGGGGDSQLWCNVWSSNNKNKLSRFSLFFFFSLQQFKSFTPNTRSRHLLYTLSMWFINSEWERQTHNGL